MTHTAQRHYFRCHPSGSITVWLEKLDYDDEYGRWRVNYRARMPDGTMFSGDQFFPLPTRDPESRQAAIDLLWRVVMPYSERDPSFFADYTPEQLAFAQSPACFFLSMTLPLYA